MENGHRRTPNSRTALPVGEVQRCTHIRETMAAQTTETRLTPAVLIITCARRSTPRRNSFLTGRRPERTRCLNFMTDFRKQHGDAWTSLPQWFKNHGYFTSAAGKLYHDGMDDPLSWSYPSNQTEWIQCQKDDLYMNVSNSNYCGVWAGSSKDIVDEDLILTEGLKRMDLAAASGKPWFVGIGTHRPHWASRLPKGWYGPQAYPAGGPGPDPVKPPAFPSAISDAPWMSGNWFGGDYKDPAHGCPNCTVPPSRANEYRRWYYAAVSYADHMLGQALAKLNAMGPDVVANTIVVMHSDHGYFLVRCSLRGGVSWRRWLPACRVCMRVKRRQCCVC